MSLNWIEFENHDINLKIDKVDFNSDISLLVGLTAAGKSQIVNAIEILRGIAIKSTESFQCVSGALSVNIDGVNYVWEVKTSHLDDEVLDNSEGRIQRSNFLHLMYYDSKTVITYEKLSCSDEMVLFERSDTRNYINGFDNIPLIDDTRSYISLYSREGKINTFYTYLHEIHQVWCLRGVAYKLPESLLEQTVTFHKAFFSKIDDKDYNVYFPSNKSLIDKIAIIQNTNPVLWDEIKNSYSAIFPEVQDIVIKPCFPTSNMMTIFVITQGDAVDIGNISAGMNKLLHYIVDIQIASDNSILLIDEVENGLGVNCIDSIWEMIKSRSQEVQFIITSHHPYIISNLEQQKIKIIKRIGNVVKNYSGDDFKLTKTNLDSYDVIFNKLLFGEEK